MKKLSLLLLILFSITSCKNEEKNVKTEEKMENNSSSTTEKTNCDPNIVYNGEGKYDTVTGTAKYTISLPKDVHDEVKQNVKYHRVDGKIIIELNIKAGVSLVNPNNDKLTLEFKIPNFNNETGKIEVMSWHDSEPLKNDEDCRVAINECGTCGSREKVVPKSCGLGTIRP